MGCVPKSFLLTVLEILPPLVFGSLRFVCMVTFPFPFLLPVCLRRWRGTFPISGTSVFFFSSLPYLSFLFVPSPPSLYLTLSKMLPYKPCFLFFCRFFAHEVFFFSFFRFLSGGQPCWRRFFDVPPFCGLPLRWLYVFPFFSLLVWLLPALSVLVSRRFLLISDRCLDAFFFLFALHSLPFSRGADFRRNFAAF